MSIIVGIRKREWPQMVLYSLLFSALGYLILLKLLPLFSNLWPLNALEMQKAANQISNIGNKEYFQEFHNVIKIALACIPITASLGYLIGRARKSRFFRKVFSSLSNRTQNTDIWNDFHELYRIGPHTVVLKNGDAFCGHIIMASDSLTGMDRGIIIQSPIYLKSPIQNSLEHKDVLSTLAPGNILVFSSEIAYISDNMHPSAILRAQRLDLVGRTKRSILYRIKRRIRKSRIR